MSALLSRRPLDATASGAGANPRRRIMPVLASLAVAGLLAAFVITPLHVLTGTSSAYAYHGAVGAPDAQTLDVVLAATAPSQRTAFSAEPAPPPAWASVPANEAVVPDPDTAKGVGYQMVQAMGWDDNEWSCLSALWDRESNWNVTSGNADSGAYGIPQALPGDKMAAAGPDWQTDPATQIAWGISYIVGRYGTPCAAWQHSQDEGWY